MLLHFQNKLLQPATVIPGLQAASRIMADGTKHLGTQNDDPGSHT